MKYALVNGERHEAQPKLIGKCICCDSSVIAKCGTIKVPHWAHKSKLVCDPWWENETEWHRTWKNQFPKERQEVIHITTDGEKHIADVKTDEGYVIEFQHSPIKPEERQSRETFYKKMIWIIDGTRRTKDKSKFIDAWNQSTLINNKKNVRLLDDIFGNKCSLLRDWGNCAVPVFFDFGEDMLYSLLPKINEKRCALIIHRNELISLMHSTPQVIFVELSYLFATYLQNSQSQQIRYPSRTHRYLRL